MESPTVSFFENIKRQKKKDIAIDEIFNLIRSGLVKDKIELLRKADDQKEREKIKQGLPAITVSGIFNKGHSQSDFKQHSGLIQIDFDHVPDPKQLKALLSNDIFTFCTFISPTATGVKVIVKINLELHNETFLQLQVYYLEKYGLPIDEKCKDITRLMFLSYDKAIFVNENSMQFNSTGQDVEKIISQIEFEKLDITSPYDNWLNIGFGFAETFGETGRGIFHRVSSFHPKYDYTSCEKQFNECLKSRKNGVTIKTFFKIAKDFGVTVKHGNNIGISLPKKPITTTTNEVNEKPKNETSKFYIVEKYLNEKFDFRYNEVANEVEFKDKQAKNFKNLNENNLYRHLQLNNVQFSQNNLLALLRSDFVMSYNPFIDYFESLPKWDEKTDHISNLCSYIKTKDQKRFHIHFKKAFVRCVACALGQCFNKHAFILIGGQSSGKTTFIRWLCPPKLDSYKAENISTDKDSLISLTENFLINLDELAGFQRNEINAFKSMLSKDAIKIRRPFDKKPTISIRRANFFGSTNKDEFLADETGSVRWLCFDVLEINWSYKNGIDINTVWAQAYTLLKQGFKYELTADEREENENANAEYQHRSTEMELIQKYFVPAKKEDIAAEAMTATDILERINTKSTLANNLSKINVGKALALLGFKKETERLGESKMPIKVYWVTPKQ